MLILPRGPYHIGDKVVINGRPWLIQECDDYTSPGISYYSLEATRIAKECDDTSLLWEDEEDEVDKVQPNELIALSTEDAYYSCDKQIQIEKRELNQIAFRIPYGISDVTVFVRENGEEVAYKYKVVL